MTIDTETPTDPVTAFWQAFAQEVQKLPINVLYNRPPGVQIAIATPPGVSVMQLIQSSYQARCADFLNKDNNGSDLPDNAPDTQSFHQQENRFVSEASEPSD